MDKAHDIRKGLGKRIRLLRTSRRLTQERLGEMAGLSYKFIGEMERGAVNSSIDSLAGIAEALGVNIGDMFPKEPDIFSNLDDKDIRLVKKSLRLLNRTFQKL